MIFPDRYVVQIQDEMRDGRRVGKELLVYELLNQVESDSEVGHYRLVDHFYPQEDASDRRPNRIPFTLEGIAQALKELDEKRA